ncbi:MAG: AEC family transporter [Polyangiales bacterium]
MPAAVVLKLAVILLVVLAGWVAGRMRWLGAYTEHSDPARVLSNAAFYLFVPALLFRTTAKADFATLPWLPLVAYFGPAVALLLLVYGYQKLRARPAHPATPSVRAMAATFGNSVQIGIPMASALFGEAGLSIHVTVVSMHALTLMTLSTAFAELDLAHAEARALREGNGDTGRRAHLTQSLLRTARSTVVHPVTLPVLLGLAWNALVMPVPALADEVLQTLGQAVVPLCLVLIGLSLAQHGATGVRGAIAPSALKLLGLPALVLTTGYFVLGMRGLPLSVIVMCAALPSGANALLFAQRYRTLEAETTAGVVVSTLAFALNAPLWLAVLSLLS